MYLIVWLEVAALRRGVHTCCPLVAPLVFSGAHQLFVMAFVHIHGLSKAHPYATLLAHMRQQNISCQPGVKVCQPVKPHLVFHSGIQISSCDSAACACEILDHCSKAAALILQSTAIAVTLNTFT